MALARLAGQYSIMMTPRGPGTLYVLSIPYKLLGDKGVPSAELMNRLYKSAGGFSAQKPNVFLRRLVLVFRVEWRRPARL